MCNPAVIIGVISAGLGFVQYQNQIAAQNKAIENQNQNMIAQYEQAKLQTQANRFNQDQNEQSVNLANETSEVLAKHGQMKEIAAVNLNIAKVQEESAREKQKAKLKTVKEKGSILATGRGGISIQNLIADVDAQYGQFDYASERNLAFAGYQANLDKESANVRYARNLAQLNPYIKQTFIDPARPILRDKVRGNTGLAIASAALLGAQAGMNWSSSVNKAGYQWKGWGGGGYQKITKPVVTSGGLYAQGPYA